MTAQRIFSCLLVTVGLASLGCTVETTSGDLNQAIFAPLNPMGGPSDPEDSPPGSLNGFGPACRSDPHLIAGFRNYGVQRLWNPSTDNITYGTLPQNSDMDLVPQTCREEALKYLIRCATPRDTFTVDPVTGARYWGWLNLAPNWTTGSIGPDEEWWITACVFQHLNGFHAEVRILLDGNNSRLIPTPADLALFNKKDSRIWGNMFAYDDIEEAFAPNVCYEDDLLSSCSKITVVNTRMCDNDPSLNCDVNIVGACKDVCTYSAAGGYHCGAAGAKNIGSRLIDFTTLYGTMCTP